MSRPYFASSWADNRVIRNFAGGKTGGYNQSFTTAAPFKGGTC
jgi:hypothetical protein